MALGTGWKRYRWNVEKQELEEVAKPTEFLVFSMNGIRNETLFFGTRGDSLRFPEPPDVPDASDPDERVRFYCGEPYRSEKGHEDQS